MNNVTRNISRFFTSLFGRISWSSPPWLTSLRQKIVAHPKQSLGLVVGLLLIVITTWIFRWYTHLPQPTFVTVQITPPKTTPNEEMATPDKLTLQFGIQTTYFSPKSVAPLNMIGKDVVKGITLTPAMPGKWSWENDNELTFSPEKDWPAGQPYQIHFDKTLFSAKTKLESMDYSFTTIPFQANISEFKFYQDPVDPTLRQAVATIQFNYPVDTNSFENKVSLLLQAIKNNQLDLRAEQVKLQITYDERKRVAYLHSEPLSLPKVERFLELVLDKGIKPSHGPSETMVPMTETVLIPDAGSYFKIKDATANLVRNNQDRPEQILALETTIGVSEAELNKSLHVYILPEDYPATSTEDAKIHYHWKNPGEVTPSILALSTPLTWQAIPADRDYATLHTYQFNVKTPRYIYVKLDKGIHGFGDYVLTNDYVTVLKVPDYPKEIGFLHKGALLALSGEKKLSVVVRGLPAVKFQIARVLPDDINHLITQTQGNFSDPHFSDNNFNQNNISEIFSEIQSFDNNDAAKEQYTALDLGKYLASQSNTDGPLGLFLLQASGWDLTTKMPLDVKNSRLILITDLGLLVKDNNDGTHDVFVQSITTGNPVSHVKVSILGKNGLPILSNTTDVNGHVSFPTLKDFVEEREPTVYLANHDKDVAFIPYNNFDRQLNYSKCDIGGVTTTDQNTQQLTSYVFSDRGIYRPGDTAHIGMIVKQAFVEPQPPGLPLEVIISDPRGTTVKDQKMTLDATGLLSVDFATDANAPTGQYIVSLYIVKDNHASSLLGSTTIRVAEFLPDRMRITSQLFPSQTKGWVSPIGLTAKIGLWNLYGAPATNRKISAKIVLAPQHVQFKEYPAYIFVDPLVDPKKPEKVFTDTLPDATTNAEGQADIHLNLEHFDKATYQLTLFAEGFEAEGGRSVATQTVALVSPLAYLIGYHPDGDLQYIKQHSQRTVNFIAINPQLKQQSVANLKIQLLALHPVTSLVKNANGTYQYKSLIQTTVVNTTPLNITEQGVNYSLPTNDIGDFAVTIIDQNSTELSRVNYSVIGSGQVALAKNAELTVKLNKSEFTAGDDIELQINAPYTGAGLITIERDKVYAYQWFKADMTNSVQKIHIPANFVGNGYVNVAFIRDWNSPDIFTSPLSYSAIPFTVNHDNHAIHIDLTIPALARPGEPFTIDYKSDKSGKIIVFAVDEGILQVANYPTPNPLEFFFQKHALEVLTQQTVDQILPKFMADRELSAVGGDGGEAALRNHLNPFKRKTDLPVVYWSGIVDTDPTTRQLTYTVPDYFNGTLHVMAVAVADNAVGSASKTSEVRGDFVINPNVPTFVAPGDEFEITSSIANNVKQSGKDAQVSVELSATSALEIVGNTKQTLAISEGQEQTVRFKVRAKPQLGSAQLTLTTTLGHAKSKMNATLSVRPANVYLTSIQSGHTDKSSLSLSLDRDLYPDYRNIDAVISTNPLIMVVGLQRYLDNFPFGCTEQLVSKAMPLLAMANQPWFTDKPQVITDKIQATIQMLGQRQLSSGAFSYWPNVGDNSSNTFASLYAMQFLLEARGQGYIVPNDMYHAGLSYLKELAAETVTRLEEARLQAYAIYLLTRNEIITTNYVTNLQLYLDKDQSHAWKKDITSTYIAATYQLLKSDATADRLVGLFKPTVESDSESYDFYNNNIASAQYLYLLAHHFPNRLSTIGKNYVIPIINAMNNNDINTVFSGYASLALQAYGQFYPSGNNAQLSMSETLSDGKQVTLTDTPQAYQRVKVTDFAKKITFLNSSNEDYFYQLIQSGFDKNASQDSIAEGLEVQREYRDLKGNSLSEATLGEEMEVHIHIRSLEKEYLSNIAIVDLLPGGFEVVRDSVHSDSMDYIDVREDRVIFFGGITTDAKELSYRIKPTNTGTFTIPPIFANSMYNPNIKARGVSGKITTHG